MSPNIDKEQDSNKIEAIKLVMGEKVLLSNSCKALSDELEGKSLLSNSGLPNRSRINELLIDISLHLGNIAGFCDKTARRQINKVIGLISVSMCESMGLYTLKLLLPTLAGIQVDYNKQPFRLVKISFRDLATIEFSK